MSKLLAAWKSFWDKPSNRTCIASVIAAIPGLLTVLMAGSAREIAIAAALGPLLFAIAKAIQPDNTAAIATSAATDVVNNSTTAHGTPLTTGAAAPAKT